MKVSDLKKALKRYGFDDNDPLLIWLNAAYHEIENAFQRWSFLEATEVGGVSLGGLPDGRFTIGGNVRRLVKVRDTTNEGENQSGGVDLEFWDRRKLQRDLSNLRSRGRPEIFTIIGSSTIQVYPVPEEERTIETSYIAALSDLVNDADEPDIPEANHYTIVRGAAYIGLQAENEEERAASAQGQFEADLSKMIDSDQIRQVGEPPAVVDVMDYA